MKKIIRILIKIPATPFVVIVGLCMIFSGYVIRFFEWVYEASDFNKDITDMIIENRKLHIKKWFTTI